MCICILYKYMVVAAAGAFEVPVFGDSLSASSERKESGAEVREVLKLAAGRTVRGTESRLMVSTKLRNHALPSYAEGFRVSST